MTTGRTSPISSARSTDSYLDTFGRGQYQGVTRDHYVEVDLGDDAPQSGPLYLIAQGWMHPTDSSINVAISQGRREPAHGLSLEVPDGHGGWVVAKPNLGFPAGRKKICLVDLTNVFRAGTPRRVRLRTNLEIYWDSIEWAQGLPDTPLKTARLDPNVADLHYRGYSVMNQANRVVAGDPRLQPYRRIETTLARSGRLLHALWRRARIAGADRRSIRDHEFGRRDDLSFRGATAARLQGGCATIVIVGDGWIKDGDYNSTFSQDRPAAALSRQE